MPNSVLSSVTGLVIAGAGLGLYLGQSAVSEINPAYFRASAAASRFHADLASSPPSLNGVPLSLATAAPDLGGGCIGCREYPEEYIPMNDPAVESYGSYAPVRADPPELVLAEAQQYAAQGPSLEELDRVQRYAHYRVSDEDPAPARAQATAQAPEPTDDCADGADCEAVAAPTS